MSPLISVIIPMYNTAQYVEACLRSVLSQTMNDFEVLVVDDASTDNSVEVISNINDIRVKILQLSVNEGQSVARNVALDNSRGQYICFVDSDDIVHPQMLEVLYAAIVEKDADFAFGDFTAIKNPLGHTYEAYIDPTLEVIYNPSENHLTKKRKLPMMLWAKLYKKSSIGDLRFYPGIYYEDNLFSILYFDRANKGVYVPAVVYYYLKRDGSTVNSEYSLKKANSHLTVIHELHKHFASDPDRLKIVQKRFLNRLAKDSLKLVLESSESSSLLKLMRCELQKMHHNKIINYRGVPLFWICKMWWYTR